jgi:chorismate synthase
MASNSWGQIFRITTWGESHGPAIGVVIDGCPAGLEISEEEIFQALQKRSPGFHLLTSPRREKDKPQILSGVFDGKTTGTPISIMILNQDVDSSKYEPIKNLRRPGHAQMTYQEKYKIFDYRGGGRASARETACRVAAAAIAKKILNQQGIRVYCYLKQVGHLNTPHPQEFDDLDKSSIFCPHLAFEQQVHDYLLSIQEQGDSVGGIVGFAIHGMPCGLGDPIYQKLEALLAYAMMSIPASKAFSIGEGFQAAVMRGSEHNDEFVTLKETKSNHAGGILGGISNGMPIWGELVFKPTSSIMKVQTTVDKNGQVQAFQLPKGSRHDPCVAIRAVPVVEAMCYLSLVDAYLMDRVVRL